MSRSAPSRQSTRKIQYYVSVDGINYKRTLLEQAESFASKGSITMEDAAQLWASAHDGNTVTKTELRTLELVLRKHAFEDRARSFLASVMFPGGPCLFTPAPASGPDAPLALDRDRGADIPMVLPGEKDNLPTQDVELDAAMAASIAQERVPPNHDLDMDAAIAASLAESRPVLHDAAFDAGIAASLQEQPTNDDELDAAIAASLVEDRRTTNIASDVGATAAACALEPPKPDSIPASHLLAAAPSQVAPSVSIASAPPPLVAARDCAAAAIAVQAASNAQAQSVPDVLGGDRRRGAGSEMGPCTKHRRLEANATAANGVSPGRGSLTKVSGEDGAAPEEALFPDLRRLLVEEGPVQREVLPIEAPEETAVRDSVAARARATSEVDRVLAARSAQAVLGGGSREEQQGEFRRLVRLLHPDKGFVDKDDARANLAMRLCVAALQKARRQV